MLRSSLAAQACRLADDLLQPPQKLFSAAAEAPIQADIAQPDAMHLAEEQTALAAINQLNAHVNVLIEQGSFATLSVAKDEQQPPLKTAYIEELYNDSASTDDKKELQAQLVLKTHLVAALYIIDPALLTPWTNHQLSFVSSELLHKIRAADSQAKISASHLHAEQGSARSAQVTSSARSASSSALCIWCQPSCHV